MLCILLPNTAISALLSSSNLRICAFICSPWFCISRIITSRSSAVVDFFLSLGEPPHLLDFSCVLLTDPFLSGLCEETDLELAWCLPHFIHQSRSPTIHIPPKKTQTYFQKKSRINFTQNILEIILPILQDFSCVYLTLCVLPIHIFELYMCKLHILFQFDYMLSCNLFCRPYVLHKNFENSQFFSLYVVDAGLSPYPSISNNISYLQKKTNQHPL